MDKSAGGGRFSDKIIRVFASRVFLEKFVLNRVSKRDLLSLFVYIKY